LKDFPSISRERGDIMDKERVRAAPKGRSAARAVVEAVSDWRNLVSWGIANLIVSSPWIFFAALGFVTGDSQHYTTAGLIYAFQMLPIPIETAAVLVLTVAIRKLIGPGRADRNRP
jgi:hypothetical protein